MSALLFVISAAVTIVWSGSMSAMGEMPMPGGWTMSMMWMRPSGQGWIRAGATFVGMWSGMMIAMMLPSFIPELWRYHLALGTARATRAGWLTALVGFAYLVVWALLGAIVFPLGVSIAALVMQSPALARLAPIGGGAIVLIAGVLQFTAWKAHHLARWRHAFPRGHRVSATARAALLYGIRVAVACGRCCVALMAALLAVGIMDLRAMTLVTAGITVERLASDSVRASRATGVIAVATGLLLIARAVVLR